MRRSAHNFTTYKTFLKCDCDFCTKKKRYEDNWCSYCAKVKMTAPKYWENCDVCDECEKLLADKNAASLGDTAVS